MRQGQLGRVLRCTGTLKEQSNGPRGRWWHRHEQRDRIVRNRATHPGQAAGKHLLANGTARVHHHVRHCHAVHVCAVPQPLVSVLLRVPTGHRSASRSAVPWHYAGDDVLLQHQPIRPDTQSILARYRLHRYVPAVRHDGLHFGKARERERKAGHGQSIA